MTFRGRRHVGLRRRVFWLRICRRRFPSGLRRLGARSSLTRLGTAGSGGGRAAFIDFVFGHGQSSLGAVGTKEGSICEKRAAQDGGGRWRLT
jgi:hypothetical protein